MRRCALKTASSDDDDDDEDEDDDDDDDDEDDKDDHDDDDDLVSLTCSYHAHVPPAFLPARMKKGNI